jgi:hypothetical protein
MQTNKMSLQGLASSGAGFVLTQLLTAKTSGTAFTAAAILWPMVSLLRREWVK